MKRIYQYICVIFVLFIFSEASLDAEIAPLNLDNPTFVSNLNIYNKPIYATKFIIEDASSGFARGLDKGILYDMSFAYSDAFSNPLIGLLIDDDSALEDNKSFADAILKDIKSDWKKDSRFEKYFKKAKSELDASGKISPRLLADIKLLIGEYYLIPDVHIDEQQSVTINIPVIDLDYVPDKYKKSALHIVQNWKNMARKTPEQTRSSLIPLPNKYIVPGGRFRELYYWDSYFTILGLNLSGLNSVSKGMVDNFLYLVKQFGII